MLSAGVVVSVDVGFRVVDEAAAMEHLGFDGADDAFGPPVVIGNGSGGHALAACASNLKTAVRRLQRG